MTPTERPPDERRFEITLTHRKRDVLVVLAAAQEELSSLSASSDPKWILGEIIAAYDAAWNKPARSDA